MNTHVLSNVTITRIERLANTANGNAVYVLYCDCGECCDCHMKWTTKRDCAVTQDVANLIEHLPVMATLSIARSRLVDISDVRSPSEV